MIYSLLKVPQGKSAGTGKDVLADLNMPVTNQILKVRSLNVLISTFVRKLPNATTPDSRIHAQFKSIGADTGRMSSADPNVQNIPSHAQDIRHMFRATASHKEILECEADSEYISIDIPKLNRVMSGDNFIPVYSLSPGMPVTLLNDGKEVELVVNHMEDSDQDPAICHVVFGLQRTRTQIDSICSQDPKMIQSFKDGKDIYSAIASLAFNLPYEKCCEFHPETGEYQEDGKARRGEAKTIVLGEPNKVNAPSTEALVQRLLSENFVNC